MVDSVDHRNDTKVDVADLDLRRSPWGIDGRGRRHASPSPIVGVMGHVTLHRVVAVGP
jgi:hypothetical protein